mmetsp:Transcript_72609/g.199106  ORF Transcript_72609/g.199106 Transcript_72609/m.199106 type:complete len:226 (-) Transcript_72609:72-749(-)
MLPLVRAHPTTYPPHTSITTRDDIGEATCTHQPSSGRVQWSRFSWLAHSVISRGLRFGGRRAPTRALPRTGRQGARGGDQLGGEGRRSGGRTREAAARSAARARLHGLCLVRHRDLLALGHRRRARHPLLDLTRHRHERILHIRGVLRRRLKEGNVDRIRKLLCSLRLHLTLGRQVGLVAHQQLVHVLRRVPVNLMQPRLDLRKRRASAVGRGSARAQRVGVGLG